MHFIPNVLERYTEDHSSPEPELLAALRKETHQKVLQPRMLSGHLQGRLLSLISKIMVPSRILEIGTYTGYSALCLAEGLKKSGRLDTIEVNEELAPMIQSYFERSEYVNQLQLHIGHALHKIPEMEGDFDLVFIDGKKEEYLEYFDVLFDKVRGGGLILSDNILWSGKVIQEVAESDRATKTLQKYNRLLGSHPGLHTVILPFRDGLTLSYKLA